MYRRVGIVVSIPPLHRRIEAFEHGGRIVTIQAA
jgi:hypothetical protein